MKEEFIKLLKETNREGIDNLLDFLEKSDFYKAPASTRFHGSKEGGLLEHSLKVYEILKKKVETAVIPINVSEESIRIIALLHDICKTNFYKVDYKGAMWCAARFKCILHSVGNLFVWDKRLR